MIANEHRESKRMKVVEMIFFNTRQDLPGVKTF